MKKTQLGPTNGIYDPLSLALVLNLQFLLREGLLFQGFLVLKLD